MMRATGRRVRATGVTRLLYVLLALTVALSSLSVSATAADRVVGNPDGLATPPVHGVDAIPNGVESGCDLKVEVIDKMSRYAVDLTYKPSDLSVTSSGKVWNVNTLQYQPIDENEKDDRYKNHRIVMTLTNYSDLAILASGSVYNRYSYLNCYTLTSSTTTTINGVVVDGDSSKQPVQGTVTFTLGIPSWEAMATAFERAGITGDADGNCALGTITVTVQPFY